MQIVNVYDAKTNLSSLINLAVAGEEVVISRFNQPAVKLTPVKNKLSPRKFGILKGKIKIDKDFSCVDQQIEKLFYAS